jgi:hypothetical protein
MSNADAERQDVAMRVPARIVRRDLRVMIVVAFYGLYVEGGTVAYLAKK